MNIKQLTNSSHTWEIETLLKIISEEEVKDIVLTQEEFTRTIDTIALGLTKLTLYIFRGYNEESKLWDNFKLLSNKKQVKALIDFCTKETRLGVTKLAPSCFSNKTFLELDHATKRNFLSIDIQIQTIAFCTFEEAQVIVNSLTL